MIWTRAQILRALEKNEDRYLLLAKNYTKYKTIFSERDLSFKVSTLNKKFEEVARDRLPPT